MTPHAHYFAHCRECAALFCVHCGAPWTRSPAAASFTVAVVPHAQHAAAIGGSE